jgi:hypothetical protein
MISAGGILLPTETPLKSQGVSASEGLAQTKALTNNAITARLMKSPQRLFVVPAYLIGLVRFLPTLGIRRPQPAAAHQLSLSYPTSLKGSGAPGGGRSSVLIAGERPAASAPGYRCLKCITPISNRRLAAVQQMVEDGVDAILKLIDGDEIHDEIAVRFFRETGRPVWRNMTDIPQPKPN